jgi:hypothetical protein
MLPISTPYGSRSGARIDNGLKGMKVVNNQVVLSIVWLVVSIVVVFFGIYHCRANSFNYSMSCTSDGCKFTYPSGSRFNEPMYLEKTNMKYAETVYWDENEGRVADSKGVPNRKLNRMGMTMGVKYEESEVSGDTKTLKTLVFPPADMGRRKARKSLKAFKEYLNIKGPTDGLDQSHGRVVTALGVVCIIFGATSALLSCMLGAWKDEKLARVRRNFVKGRKRRD